jgi:hypothetical protein
MQPGPCGHPMMFEVPDQRTDKCHVIRHTLGYSLCLGCIPGHCTLCAEVTAAEERMREAAALAGADWLRSRPPHSLDNHIRALPITADAPPEQSYAHTCLSDATGKPPAAPIEPYPDNVAGCTCPAPCKGTTHGPREMSPAAREAVCPRCEGVNAIWISTGEFTKPFLGKCPDCHGTGKAAR